MSRSMSPANQAAAGHRPALLFQSWDTTKTLANLAWSCPDCNAHKGSDLSGLDPKTGKLERLFNPRTDRWNEHFAWNGAELAGRTSIGRVTVALLQINREERIAVRRELMAAALFPG